MKKLLVTGFEPFGGLDINPSWEAVKALPQFIGNYEITKLKLPVEYQNAADIVIKMAEEISADTVISVGVAGGRKSVSFEKVAINLRNSSMADNKNCKKEDEPVVENSREAYFTDLPVKCMAEAVKNKGVPAAVSYSAGAFVCNDVFYSLLHKYHNTEKKVGFIHLPYLPQQTNENSPSMKLEDMIKALEVAIEAIS